MLYTGILFGFSAAFFQDLGYIFSGRFVREENSPWDLLLSIRGPLALLIHYRELSPDGILRKTAAVLMMTAAVILYAIN